MQMELGQPNSKSQPAIEANLTEKILTKDCCNFLIELHEKFNNERLELLVDRAQRQYEFFQGKKPGLLALTKNIREANWSVAPVPQDLERRHVEITGPADPKMTINALNSGANLFMADFEDSLSPNWSNMLEGQSCLRDAIRRKLEFVNESGKKYSLGSELATLKVRPRGWHLTEKHFFVNGQAISGSLFDFGVYYFHNARDLLARGSGPYFYLPKLESHLEARLWAKVFQYAESRMGLGEGKIRATVLIETCLAAFEMDEILFELRNYASGLNAGRWDYIFSFIKKLGHDPSFLFPDRAQVTMTTDFMRAYCERIIETCHKRNAHAIGGMAAFIPNRKDPVFTEKALEKVSQDKAREANMGFDGSWVAHPDLVATARNEFAKVLGQEPHQKQKRINLTEAQSQDLLRVKIPSGQVTLAGVINNINVALLYIAKWIDGTGAAAIYNLMEDAATAEISRTQLWQWKTHAVPLENGQIVNAAFLGAQIELQIKELQEVEPSASLLLAKEILLELVLSKDCRDFLTVGIYDKYFP